MFSPVSFYVFISIGTPQSDSIVIMNHLTAYTFDVNEMGNNEYTWIGLITGNIVFLGNWIDDRGTFHTVLHRKAVAENEV